MKLLYRNINAIDKRLVFLIPPRTEAPLPCDNVAVDANRHAFLLADLQRLRGRVYLQDGALQTGDLSEGGRHQTPEDEKSWHLLLLNGGGGVDACVWYMEHGPMASVDHLRVRNCPLAQQPAWRRALRTAVTMELTHARQEGLRYAEVGGWAVAEPSRCSSDGLLLALAAYSLGRVLGGSLGMTTATVRHRSSTILRHLGGSDLSTGRDTLPSYYDPRYRCEMELLRFDSRRPNPKYDGLINLLAEKMRDVSMIAATEPAAPAAHQPYPYFGGEARLRPAVGSRAPVAVLSRFDT